MSETHLGHLERVDLRDIWVTEAQDFTPWLAREDNLQILAKSINIELELEAQEKNVGPFRADILCRNAEDDSWVLIENQLERTDHTHLGQLLTYAAGLNAVTIVWVSATFTNEHRAALDWLNEITDEDIRFFGLEVELWRIGDSPAAPKFNIVSKPNDWSRFISRGFRPFEPAELSETRQLQLDYWLALHELINKQRGPVQATRKPRPRSWTNFKIGRSSFKLGAVMLRMKNSIRSELYISGPAAKAFFSLLEDQREDIESDLRYPLSWEELPDKCDTRVGVYLENTDPEDRADWPRQHEWLAKTLADLHRVFTDRVRTLDPEDRQHDEVVAAE